LILLYAEQMEITRAVSNQVEDYNEQEEDVMKMKENTRFL